jgi:(p)ppGpp synthase/HD superfamily hydrolase
MMYSYRIEQAIRAASILHKDMVSEGKVKFPYVSHLFSVACIIADYTDDEDTIIAKSE